MFLPGKTNPCGTLTVHIPFSPTVSLPNPANGRLIGNTPCTLCSYAAHFRAPVLRHSTATLSPFTNRDTATDSLDALLRGATPVTSALAAYANPTLSSAYPTPRLDQCLTRRDLVGTPAPDAVSPNRLALSGATTSL